MSFNKTVEFYLKTFPSTTQKTTEPSIEDDIVSFRLKGTRRQVSTKGSTSSFKLSLVKIKNYEIGSNFMFLHRKAKTEGGNCRGSNSCLNGSFLTSEGNEDRIVSFSENRKFRGSDSRTLNLGLSLSAVNSPLLSPRVDRDDRARQLSLKNGLSRLLSLFNKKESKDLAFKFAHIKIYSQIQALEQRQTIEPVKKPRLTGSPSKREDFYRQWFKLNRSMQHSRSNTGVRSAVQLGV